MKIAEGRSFADIDSMGAYLRSLVLDGREILMGTEDGRQTHGGAASLIPYAGRIRGGKYSFGGRDYAFRPGKDGNSIHGFARETEFRSTATGSGNGLFSASLKDAGYPSVLDMEIGFAVGTDSLAVTYSAANAGDLAAPLVIGCHPYFLVEGPYELHPSAHARKLNLEDVYFPDGTYSEFDFDRSLDDIQLDSCFEGGGLLSLVSGGRTIEISRSGMDYFLVYNGEYARGRSVAVEPMTGAPDAYNNGIGLTVLEPGQKLECGFTIRLE